MLQTKFILPTSRSWHREKHSLFSFQSESLPSTLPNFSVIEKLKKRSIWVFMKKKPLKIQAITWTPAAKVWKKKKLTPFWDRWEINGRSEINSSEAKKTPQVNKWTRHMLSYTTKAFVWCFLHCVKYLNCMKKIAIKSAVCFLLWEFICNIPNFWGLVKGQSPQPAKLRI